MAVITTIVIGSVIGLSSIGAFRFGQDISQGGLGTIFQFEPELLNPSSIFQVGLDSISSPFSLIGNFLLEYLITPFILISFLILFFVAQYWLFRLYFKLGKSIFDGVVTIAQKINLESNNPILNKLKDIFNYN